MFHQANNIIWNKSSKNNNFNNNSNININNNKRTMYPSCCWSTKRQQQHSETTTTTTRRRRRRCRTTTTNQIQQIISNSCCWIIIRCVVLSVLLLLVSSIPYSIAADNHATTNQQLRAPKIKEHPTNLVVKKNDPAKLECKADGNPPPTIEWYKDNEKVDTSPGSHRMLLGNQLFFLYIIAKKGEGSDIGTYYCLAKNAVGKAKSRNATLEVALLKDEFRVMPVNTKVSLGKSVTMECVPPKGRPEPIVTWKHNGKPIQTDTGRYKMDGTNLIISDVMQHDEGQYQCIAENMIGVRESPAVNLEVLVEPYFIRPPESIKTMADSDVVFHCQVGGDPLPKISWRKIEDELAIGKSQILDDKALRIHQVKPSDEGTYVCEAENAAGKISRSATLIVNSRPTLLISPKNVQTMVNNVAKMECMATGNPEPIYFWHKESAHLLMFPGQIYGKYNVSNDGVLSINNVAKEDQGFYICSAISEVGSTMARAFLKVSNKEDVPPPIILLGPTNQTLPLNTKAFLPCEAISPDSSNVSIQWLYNQIPIYNDSHFIITPHALQILNIQRTDSGIYTCLATSASGSTSWNARLQVESPLIPHINFSKMPHSSMFPEAPSKPLKVNVTETTITLKWQRSASAANAAIAPHVGSLIEYYSPDIKYSAWQEVARHIPVDIYTVKNLKPNTRYVFYVRAQNIHGLGFPSDISDEIKTLDSNIQQTSASSSLDEMAMIQARNILNNVNLKLRDARAISSTSIKLFWNVVGSTDFIEGYYIRFQNMKNEQQPTTTTKFNMVTVFGAATSTYTLEDLQKYATYRLFVMPFYKNMEGKPSNIVIERTHEDVPSAPPYSITAKAINASCAVIEWLPPLDEHQNGIILGYYLQIYENNTYLYTNLTLDATFNSIVLYNLTLGSVFSIQMLAFTAMGKGPLSAPLYLTMDSDFYSDEDEFNRVQSNNGQHSFFSNLFWIYLFIILMTIVMFIITVRLVLVYANRKNSKSSIYEKANSLNENFSDINCPKYDSNSSKYSSCPDNNEYAEVSDFKHYGEPKAEPYAMTPLIGKSIIDHQPTTNANRKFLFHKLNQTTDNDPQNDLTTNEALLNNHHQHLPNANHINGLKREMINMATANNLPKRPGTNTHQMQSLNSNGKYKSAYDHQSALKLGSFNIFNNNSDNTSMMAGGSYEDENNQLFDPKNNIFSKEIPQPQHSLPSSRPAFSYLDRNDDNGGILNSFRTGRDGRNLMTFHQANSNSNNNTTGPIPPRIISNPLSSAMYEANSGSESGSSNKNYINHYYASSEINKMPFMINDGSSSSSLSKNSINGKLAGSIGGGSSSCYSNCDNISTLNNITTNHIDNNNIRRNISNNDNNSIHDQMVKSRIHKKRKRSNNSDILNNSFD